MKKAITLKKKKKKKDFSFCEFQERKFKNTRATVDRFTLFYLISGFQFRCSNKIYKFSLKYKNFLQNLFTWHANPLILKAKES